MHVQWMVDGRAGHHGAQCVQFAALAQENVIECAPIQSLCMMVQNVLAILVKVSIVLFCHVQVNSLLNNIIVKNLAV